MITKSASDKNNYSENLEFTNSARTGWELIINSISKLKGQHKILLPSYIGYTEREGSGIFDPVQNTNSYYEFYSLENDLSVNYDSLEQLAANNEFNILLVVHYFGICRNDLNKIKSICERYELVLVEDCAHAFQLGSAEESLGTFGDFSFYSVHKYFPVESGGIVKNISKKIEIVRPTENQQMSIDVAFQILKSEVKQIADKRKHNFKLYSKLLNNNKGIEIMYELRENEIPQTFPIRVKRNLREKLYFHLMDKSMPTIALYYRLIDELKLNKYPNVFEISSEILNLPVHQDTEETDIIKLTDSINEYFNNLS
jgi:dTDP-4-amino-4,6-dideoxygalactose transaminase